VTRKDKPRKYFKLLKVNIRLLVVMVVHTYNPSTQKAEEGGSKVQGQPGLYPVSNNEGLVVQLSGRMLA
jgi:hypothetical protein